MPYLKKFAYLITIFLDTVEDENLIDDTDWPVNMLAQYKLCF